MTCPITPFLQVNQRLRDLLDDKNRFKIDIRVVYGRSQLQPEEAVWLSSKDPVRVSFCKNLHARCFLNESEGLITSMNLYEFFQVNNEEMGFLVAKIEEPALYTEVLTEAMRLVRLSSEEVRVMAERAVPAEVIVDTKPRRARAQNAILESGVCVRCRKTLKADPTHPYCKDCYARWKVYENSDYEEKYCHLCGDVAKSTMWKPTCYDCFEKFKDVFTVPAD